ncbi:MAG: AIPR family protein [Candidatus Lokiarchaeota archaeon]|nr:AIPR family protein [Candidatus Lokiarchaeota archaeon]
MPIIWFYEKFNMYKAVKLFSANIRDYLGSRKDDANINNGIKETAILEPEKFWVYNNGITALVHDFAYNQDNKSLRIYGLSIINGAQTTGALGHLDEAPNDKAGVHVRFIKCTDQKTITNIVKFNNSQNKIVAPDFRSNDKIQTRLNEEFKTISNIVYVPRRGGHEDIIRRVQNGLYSITAGQALAAFHNKPHIAYHGKTKLWEDDSIYSTYFNEATTAKHIVFAYSLLQAVERKKTELREKYRTQNLFNIEEKQFSFLKKRGSMYLLVAGISKAIELILNKKIPNKFKLNFKKNISSNEGAEKWKPIIEVCSPFMNELTSGLSDGFKSEDQVNEATDKFVNYLASTKEVNMPVFSKFSQEVL